MRTGRSCLDEWPLDPDVTYLNHGTVGVTPRRVLDVQRAIRDRVERAPAQILLREQSGLTGARSGRPSAVREAAAVVAEFVGASASDLVFVDNSTTGINGVLRSLTFSPGDEVLMLDHAYGAITNAVRHIAGQAGATIQTVRVPYPPFSPIALLAAVAKAITPRTTLALFDHITAESAVILPVAALAGVCREAGVRVLIDGSHAPGVLQLNVPALGVDWYVANLHKWACAPRGCGFLWAHESAQMGLHPAVISWGLNQGFVAEFDWVGTRDLSGWLAAPAGLAYLRDRGIDDAWTYNHTLACDGASLLADAWRTELPAAPEDVGFMATVATPEACGSDAADAVRLRDRLLFDHSIEVQVHAGGGRVWVRISAQVYNDLDDVARLSKAVLSLKR
jgi:isopenicillin-N epimerase